MIAALDTHVHFYPCYDFERGLEAAWQNLSALSPDGETERCCVLYLTERADCQVFQTLRDNPSSLLRNDFFRIHSGTDAEVLRAERRAGGDLYIVAGRQIATAERLEVLALHTCAEFKDRCGISESISAARQAGATVVLNWSLGKWMFARGRIIEELLGRAKSDEYLLGDVPARPLGWGEPRLITVGRKRGLVEVCGSDPLPFPGEEVRIGSYATLLRSAGRPENIGFFRDVLLERGVERRCVGVRNTPWVAGMRLWRNSRTKGR